MLLRYEFKDALANDPKLSTLVEEELRKQGILKSNEGIETLVSRELDAETNNKIATTIINCGQCIRSGDKFTPGYRAYFNRVL